MNNYIISPSWFYIVHVLTSLNILGSVGLAGSIVVSIVFEVIILTDWDITEEDKLARMKKIRNIGGLIFLISSLVLLFIPSEETFIKMKLAEFATYENADLLMNQIKETADYIIQQIK